MTIYDNASKIRARKMAWMREKTWLWHLIHTDTYANTIPTFGILENYRFKRPTIALGHWNRPMGPPKSFYKAMYLKRLQIYNKENIKWNLLPERSCSH